MALAETRTGSPFDILTPFLDANGSPQTGAVSAGGSMSVYGPGSATVVVAGPSTISDYGGGDYGIAATGAQLSVPGYYRWEIPTVTFGTRVFATVRGGFTVGDIPPEYRTLRGVIRAVVEKLDCGIFGTSTGGDTDTLIDTRWLDAGYSTNEFVDHELLILEPTNGDANPVRVSTSNPAAGSFDFKPAITSLGLGKDYILIRPGQKRLRYARIKELIDEAITDLAWRQDVTDEVTLTTVNATNRYTLPNTFLNVSSVKINRITGGTEEYWEEFPPADYEYWPDRRLLVFKRWLGSGYPLRVEGRVAITPPTRMGQIVRVPWRAIVNQVAGYLSLPDRDQAGLQVQQARAMASRVGTRG